MNGHHLNEGEIFDALEHNGARIWEAISGLSDADLQQTPQEGGWAIAEIIPYLHEGAWMSRNDVQHILSEDNPILPCYEDIVDVLGNVKYNPPDEIAALLQELDATNKQLAAQLRGLDLAAWNRRANHRGYGEVTLPQLLDYHLKDQSYYVRRIREIADAVKGTHPQLAELFAVSIVSVWYSTKRSATRRSRSFTFPSLPRLVV